LAHQRRGSTIIDGEIVVPAADGTTDFSVRQNELKGKSTSIETHLKKLITKTAIQFSESFDVDGPEMSAHACGVGLEGVVSKVRDSRYPSGRGNDWVKKTCQRRETLPIAGFALKANKFDGIYSAGARATT
jgi:bifunctional non-homologous end joining protein LigD